MKIKDVIISALKLLGRAELAAKVEGGGEKTAEENESVDTLLYCVNAVEDEVARCYLPLKAEENCASANGKFSYLFFAHTPVRILRVTADGKEIDFTAYPDYVKADAAKITVEYEYSPSKKGAEDECEYDGETGEYLLAYGAASEYCLINGEVQAAEFWESKYRTAIDAMHRTCLTGAKIPPRRWV